MKKSKLSALEAGVVYLGYRARSQDEVRAALLRKGYPKEEVEDTIVRLTEYKLLNDAEFAESWVRTRDAVQPRSSRVLRGELAAKGVPREMIDSVITPQNDFERAKEVASRLLRRYANLPKELQQTRSIAALARRGFSYDVSRRALGEISKSLGDDLPISD